MRKAGKDFSLCNHVDMRELIVPLSSLLPLLSVCDLTLTPISK